MILKWAGDVSIEAHCDAPGCERKLDTRSTQLGLALHKLAGVGWRAGDIVTESRQDGLFFTGDTFCPEHAEKSKAPASLVVDAQPVQPTQLPASTGAPAATPAFASTPVAAPVKPKKGKN